MSANIYSSWERAPLFSRKQSAVIRLNNNLFTMVREAKKSHMKKRKIWMASLERLQLSNPTRKQVVVTHRHQFRTSTIPPNFWTDDWTLALLITRRCMSSRMWTRTSSNSTWTNAKRTSISCHLRRTLLTPRSRISERPYPVQTNLVVWKDQWTSESSEIWSAANLLLITLSDFLKRDKSLTFKGSLSQYAKTSWTEIYWQRTNTNISTM